MKKTQILLLCVAAITLAGCYEEPKVAVHEPGQYLGPQDQLLQVAGTAEQSKRLAKRFQMVQTDR